MVAVVVILSCILLAFLLLCSHSQSLFPYYLIQLSFFHKCSRVGLYSLLILPTSKKKKKNWVTSRRFSFASSLWYSMYRPCIPIFKLRRHIFLTSHTQTHMHTETAVQFRKKRFIDIQTPWNDLRARANHFYIYPPNSHKSSQTKHNNNNGTTIIVEWCVLLFNRCLSRLSTKYLLLLLSNSLSLTLSYSRSRYSMHSS